MGYDSSVGCEECRHGEAFSESRGNFCARTYIFVMGEEGGNCLRNHVYSFSISIGQILRYGMDVACESELPVSVYYCPSCS